MCALIQQLHLRIHSAAKARGLSAKGWQNINFIGHVQNIKLIIPFTAYG